MAVEWTAVIVALIVGLLGIVGQWALKKQDYLRQDEVADEVRKAAEQAVKVAEQAATAASLLLRENQRVAAASLVTNAKIDSVAIQATEIHGLVNSAMSEEMRRNLQSQEALLIVLVELQEVKRAAGLPPSGDAQSRIEATKETIAELEAALGDRLRSTLATAETKQVEERQQARMMREEEAT